MRQTRRGVLAAIGATTAVGLAGCLGDDTPETSYDCDLDEPDPVNELPQPAIGETDAPVTVDLYEDYTCGGCAAFATGPFEELLAEFVETGDARFYHYDFPIPVDETWAYPIASAARAVQDTEGDGAFFEFSKGIYERFDDYSWQVVGDVADDVGADPCAVIARGHHETYRAVSEAERTAGEAIGVPGTPTIVVEGTIVEYSSPAEAYDPIASAIRDHLD